MTTSRRVANAKAEKFAKNIHGGVKVETKKPSRVAVGPIVLGFFLFVVIGSALLQIIQTATSGGIN